MNFDKLSPEILETLLTGEPELVALGETTDATLLNIFVGIERPVRDMLLTEQTYARGDILCHEGADGDAMYLIRSGRVVAFKGDPQTPIILGYRGPGEIIGEMTLLEDRPRSATVAALEDVRVFHISRERFQEIVAQHPAVGLRMMAGLSARLRQADAVRTVKTQASKSLQRCVLELQDREQHLLELQRVREETSDLIIHDLRNPLGIIYGTMQMLEITLPETALADNRELLNMATAACHRMQIMVNSLLEAARLESGDAQLNLSPFRISHLIHNLLPQFRPATYSAGIVLENQTPEDLPFVTADSDKIERVLCNLVDNAIKHLGNGGRIILTARQKAAYLEVSVTDNGPGIPTEERERIFERFTQVREDRVKRRGFGLGLSFCKLTIQAHGGCIWAEAGPDNVGSRFVFTLPLAGPD